MSFGKGQRMVATDLFTVYLLECIQTRTVKAAAASMPWCKSRSWKQQQTSSRNLEARNNKLLASCSPSFVEIFQSHDAIKYFHRQNNQLEIEIILRSILQQTLSSSIGASGGNWRRTCCLWLLTWRCDRNKDTEDSRHCRLAVLTGVKTVLARCYWFPSKHKVMLQI